MTFRKATWKLFLLPWGLRHDANNESIENTVAENWIEYVHDFCKTLIFAAQYDTKNSCNFWPLEPRISQTRHDRSIAKRLSVRLHFLISRLLASGIQGFGTKKRRSCPQCLTGYAIRDWPRRNTLNTKGLLISWNKDPKNVRKVFC